MFALLNAGSWLSPAWTPCAVVDALLAFHRMIGRCPKTVDTNPKRGGLKNKFEPSTFIMFKKLIFPVKIFNKLNKYTVCRQATEEPLNPFPWRRTPENKYDHCMEGK